MNVMQDLRNILTYVRHSKDLEFIFVLQHKIYRIKFIRGILFYFNPFTLTIVFMLNI